MTLGMEKKSNFRSDINGLRALAVIAVVIYHFNKDWMPGGFAGVDVFFVISGYLMTSIIFTGLINESFSLLKFYMARAKRIIPALTFACAFILFFGWLYLPRQEFITLSKHVLSSLLFLSNFMYWSEAGYFDIASKSKFLLHTWSLSAEWQFYLIYPFIVIAALRLAGKKTAKFILLMLAVASFAFCIFSSLRWPDASYFLLPSRSWEMLAGGVAFLFPTMLPARCRVILYCIGMSLIIFSFTTFDESYVWPGYLSSVPVLGAFLVIYAGLNKDYILSSKASQYIGLWSYSIYLWHWVILSIIYYFNPFYSVSVAVLGILLSLPAGYLSYKFIETRKSFSVAWKTSATLAFISIIAIANTNLLQKVRDITAQYDTNDWVEIYKDFKDSDMGGDYWVPCASGWQMAYNHTTAVAAKCVENKGTGGVFVLGDSHAAAIAVGVRNILKDGVPYNQLATPGCIVNWDDKPTLMGNKNFSKGCDYQNQLSKKAITELKPAVVILIRARGHELVHLERLATQMKAVGVQNVLILGPVPQWMPSLPVALSKPKKVMGDYLITNALRKDIFKTNEIIKNQYAKSGSVTFVDVIGSMCHKVGVDNACRYRADNKNLMTFDYGHPTDLGADLIAEKVIKPLMPVALVR